MNKVYPDAKTALADVLEDGMTLMSGGFGLCGSPQVLIEAVRDSGAKDLTSSPTMPASTGQASASCSRHARSRR